MAPLFQNAIEQKNIILPRDFVEVLTHSQNSTPTLYATWNPEKDFLVRYRYMMEKYRHGDPHAYYLVKELRVQEFRNTIEIVNQGYYTTEGGKHITFPSDKDMMHNTVFYEHEFRAPDAPQNSETTIVEIQNIDCLYAGVQLKEQGYNPAVLNMASQHNPGGGVTSGSGAQEETLFRRTNIFRSLYQFASYAWQYGIAPSLHQYPLDSNFGGVYTPSAIYFRDSEQKGYALLDNPVTLSLITVAGINRPTLTADNRIADHLVDIVKNKIRTIFRIGLANRHDSLVLGALGCGAFRNPPRHVARLFHEVMDEPEFMNRYKKIVFAILDDHNAHRQHNPEGNFKPFADEFEGMDTPRPTAEQKEALQMWTMGAGNSAKRFNGENPIPPKNKMATKGSWKVLPMPNKKTVVSLNLALPADAMRIIRYGHIPEAMEDHWFMYCDEDTIYYHRSWTGICIFEAKYEEYGGNYRITCLSINRDSEQYGSTDSRKDAYLFLALLTEEYGGDANKYWNKALK